MQKFIPAVAIVLLSASFAAPQDLGTGPCTLLVHVTGFRNSKGKAGGAVFTSPKGWPENITKSLAHGGFPIDQDHATLTFHLPAGKYAVAVLHDENMNHKLDRNLLGIPKEGFGFANNPRVGLRAPDWKDAAINVACPVTEINVKLIYK